MIQIKACFKSSIVLVILLVISLTFTSPAATNAEGDETLAALAAPSAYPGNDLHFERLTSEDGLSSNRGLSALRDSRGFMQFGTQDGLSRYDPRTEQFTSYIRPLVMEFGYVRTLSAALLLSILTFSAAIPVFGEDGDPPSPPQFSNQSIRFDHLTTDDGLSSNEALSILQDSNGYMWFGTFNGPNRYDGHTITVDKSDPVNLETFSNNRITRMFADQQGNTWAYSSSNGSLSKFDPVTETLTRYLHDPEDPGSISSSGVRPPIKDQHAFLWMATIDRTGLEKYDPLTENFTHYVHDPEDPSSIGGDRIGPALFVDQEGYLWTGDGHWDNRIESPSIPPDPAVAHVRAALASASGDDYKVSTRDRSGSCRCGVGRASQGGPYPVNNA